MKFAREPPQRGCFRNSAASGRDLGRRRASGEDTPRDRAASTQKAMLPKVLRLIALRFGQDCDSVGRFLTVAADADDFEVMLSRSKAGFGRHCTDGPLDAGIADLLDRSATLADQVMVMLIGADDVCAAALVGVEPIQHSDLDQQVEGPEDRRPANPPSLQIVVELLGRELAVLPEHRFDNSPASLSLAESALGKLTQHPSAIVISLAFTLPDHQFRCLHSL
jgi:hypothetical protein